MRRDRPRQAPPVAGRLFAASAEAEMSSHRPPGPCHRRLAALVGVLSPNDRRYQFGKLSEGEYVVVSLTA